MRVLHVCETISGGIATYLNTILEEQLIKYGYENVSTVLSREQSSQLDYLPKNQFYFNKISRKQPLDILRIIRCYLNAIRDFSPDIIHVHSTYAGFYIRMLALFGFIEKKKIIYCSHGWAFNRDVGSFINKFTLLAEKILQNYCSKIVCISSHDEKSAISNGLSKRMLVTVKNTIRSIDKRTYPYARPDIDSEKINLLFVGRYDEQKGIDILLKAIKAGIQEKIHFYFIGGNIVGNDAAESLSNLDNVTDLGWQKETVVFSYMKACDAIFIPSRWEGFGLVALEALCNGCPVYYSYVGGLKETCDNVDFCTPITDLDFNNINRMLNSLSKDKLLERKQRCSAFTLNYSEKNLVEALDKVYLGVYE